MKRIGRCGSIFRLIRNTERFIVKFVTPLTSKTDMYIGKGYSAKSILGENRNAKGEFEDGSVSVELKSRS